MFGDLKAGVAGILCLALGILGGGAVALAYDAWFVIPVAESAAAEAATTAADARWQKQIADAKAQADAARRTAEVKIADAERFYLERDAVRASQMTALEHALQMELADAPIPSPAGRPGVCRPAVSRGVRDALQHLGRAGPREDPAEPDPALRPSR